MTDPSGKAENCIFCDIISGRIPSHKIFENEHVFVFMSLEGHPLIVPKVHFRDIFDLDDVHAAEIMKTAVIVARATKKALQCDGINLVQSSGAAAGQDVFHFHLHIKPRFEDDEGVAYGWGRNSTLRV